MIRGFCRLKILILKPSSLGDVVQAMPVLRLLRLRFPGAEIHWWIADSLGGLLEGDPDLDGLFRFDRRSWKRPSKWKEAISGLRRMRRERFDWVIDLQSLLRSGLAGWLARGGLCVGLNDPREGAPAFHDLSVSRPSEATHAVDWYLEVLAALDVPIDAKFEWIPRRETTSLAVRTKWSVDGFKWVGLQPGARWMNKRWPVQHFIALARRIVEADPTVRVAVFGATEDGEHGRSIVSALGAGGGHLDLTGRTTLAETVEWLRLCRVLVTNDTGPMHIAAALGTRVVAVFGPTDPRRTGPYGQIQNVVRLGLGCSPCMRASCANKEPLACMTGLDPERVLRMVLPRLEG